MKNSGFTLIEMVVTMAILTIILAICVPKISIEYGYMDKMAKEFVMDLRYIQMENMKNPGYDYKIRIYSDIGKYTINNNEVVVKDVIFKERYKITYSNSSTISFNCEGTPINAGTLTITDKKTNETRGISIFPATGRTIIKE